MDKALVDREEILSAARMTQGIERMDEIKYTTVENDGRSRSFRTAYDDNVHTPQVNERR